LIHSKEDQVAVGGTEKPFKRGFSFSLLRVSMEMFQSDDGGYTMTTLRTPTQKCNNM